MASLRELPEPNIQHTPVVGDLSLCDFEMQQPSVVQ
jgi:hypothetical protein